MKIEMTLEEEKKLVADWMGYTFQKGIVCTGLHRFGGTTYVGPDWNIDTERKWWDEIWEKIGSDLKIGLPFIRILRESLPINDIPDWPMLTAKPEICWKALIKTLTTRPTEN